MALNVNACLKAFSVAFCQYCSHPSDQTLKDVERQMDVLIGISSTGKALNGFMAKELLPTECLTSLVSMLTEKNNKLMLTSKCISLLYSLANDDDTRIVLRDSYHLTSTVAGLLLYHCSKASANEKIIFQCLQLLQRVTYDCKQPVALGYIEELIKFLINQIQSSENELTLPSLGLLANLCRNNIAVQAQVKALDNIKYIYRTLIRFLSHGSLTVIVYALSLLTSLALYEQLGEKLFNARNINQTFQLLFNILVNGEGILPRKYAADLFVDLLRSEKIRQSMLNYDHLEYCLEQVLHLLANCQPEEAAKIFEFFLAFCAVSELRLTLLRVFVRQTGKQDNRKDAFESVFFWMSHSVESHYLVSIKALAFLKEVYEEIINNGAPSDFHSRAEQLLPSLVTNLEPPANTKGSSMKRKFKKIAGVLDILTVLASEDPIAKMLVKTVKLDIFQNLVQQQYQSNDIAMKEKLSFTADWSEMGVLVALKSLDLMNRLNRQANNMKEMKTFQGPMVSLLKDDRLTTFIAHTLTNAKKDHIQTALRVLKESCTQPDFQISGLGELIFANNVTKHEEVTSLRQRHDDVTCSPVSDSVLDPSLSVVLKNPPRSSSSKRRGKSSTSGLMNSTRDESTIESLIDKMKSGMEIRDPKASEIMDVYEAKLASLQTKEGHLQDLLEAKTLALAQSDRMISQYRCRRAQSEAECSKLRHMLQETEKRNESQSDQIQSFEQSQKMFVKQMEQLAAENHDLQVISGEHDQLKTTFAEQSQRLETLKKALSAAQDEHKSLSELNEMLRRHNDNLKSQHDCATRQLQELEDERKKVMQQLKQKDTKLSEMSKALEQQSEEIKKKDEEIAKTRKSLDKTKGELQKTEQARKELTHKVSSLELVCNQREQAVKEKEQQLTDQQTNLDKYAQMSAMIHSLTSGNIQPALLKS